MLSGCVLVVDLLKTYDITCRDTCQSRQQLNEWTKFVWPLTRELCSPAPRSRSVADYASPGVGGRVSGGETDWGATGVKRPRDVSKHKTDN